MRLRHLWRTALTFGASVKDIENVNLGMVDPYRWYFLGCCGAIAGASRGFAGSGCRAAARNALGPQRRGNVALELATAPNYHREPEHRHPAPSRRRRKTVSWNRGIRAGPY